jgi:hypothetical protein
MNDRNAARRALCLAAIEGLLAGLLPSACSPRAATVVAPMEPAISATPPAPELTRVMPVAASPSIAEASAKDCCRGKNECKGKSGCAGQNNECKGKNDCKGQGTSCDDADEPPAHSVRRGH